MNSTNVKRFAFNLAKLSSWLSSQETANVVAAISTYGEVIVLVD